MRATSDVPLCSELPRAGVLRRTRCGNRRRGPVPVAVSQSCLMRPSLRSQATMCARVALLHALLESTVSESDVPRPSLSRPHFQRMSSGRRSSLASQIPSLCRYEHTQAQLKKSMSISSPCDWPFRPSVHALISFLFLDFWCFGGLIFCLICWISMVCTAPIKISTNVPKELYLASLNW